MDTRKPVKHAQASDRSGPGVVQEFFAEISASAIPLSCGFERRVVAARQYSEMEDGIEILRSAVGNITNMLLLLLCKVLMCRGCMSSAKGAKYGGEGKAGVPSAAAALG